MGMYIEMDRYLSDRVIVNSKGEIMTKQVWALLLFTSLCSIAIVNAAPPKPPKGFKWVLVDTLSDEFDGQRLNRKKWRNYHPSWSGRKPSKFKKSNTFLKGGKLHLRSTLKRDPSKVKNPFSDIWVNAAVCVSRKKARPGYYYETSFKASSLSMTSSFWFRIGKYSEIDVIEHIGNPSRKSRQDDLPYQYHANTHYYGMYKDRENYPPKASEWHMPTRGDAEFHLYGFWWKDPKELLFYHNDKEVMQIEPRVPLEERLHMIFDTEVFPFAQAGVAKIGLPLVKNLKNNKMNTMLVDFVRTYKLVPK